MGDDGGEHDAADDQRPGRIPTNPKHVAASVSGSSGRRIKVTASQGCCSQCERGAGEALFWFGRPGAAIGLTGVALCHDVLVARPFMRTRRRFGLAGLATMLAAHIGLAFEVVFTGHEGSMRSYGIGSQSRRLL